MTKYVALLRGINVGGKNKVPMIELKKCFEELGFENVLTYINSGNVVFESNRKKLEVSKKISAVLIKTFKSSSEPIKVLVISKDELENVIKNAPKGFGKKPDTYYSDVVFLIDLSSDEAFKSFDPNPEVDTVWKGTSVIYFQRLATKRTKSRLSKIIGKPVYKNMTIRNWNTTTKLLSLMEKL